jgi:cell division protein FtsB
MMDEVPATEPTAVQLTRMEGILTLVAYKTDNLVLTVGQHAKDIAGLQLKVQSLDQEAEAREKTVEQTAKALREAKETADATARAEMQKSAAAWTPMTRLFAVTTAIGGVIAAYASIRPH